MQEVRIPFRNWSFIAWANTQGSDARIAIKPICEAIGVAWPAQHDKIKRDPKFNCNDIVMVASDGKQRSMATLPVKELNGWLFGINSKKVSPEVADALLDFQRYCFDAIYAAVSGSANTSVVAELSRRLDMAMAMIQQLMQDNARLNAKIEAIQYSNNHITTIEASCAVKRLNAQKHLKLVC